MIDFLLNLRRYKRRVDTWEDNGKTYGNFWDAEGYLVGAYVWIQGDVKYVIEHFKKTGIMPHVGF